MFATTRLRPSASTKPPTLSRTKPPPPNFNSKKLNLHSKTSRNLPKKTANITSKTWSGKTGKTTGTRNRLTTHFPTFGEGATRNRTRGKTRATTNTNRQHRRARPTQPQDPKGNRFLLNRSFGEGAWETQRNRRQHEERKRLHLGKHRSQN